MPLLRCIVLSVLLGGIIPWFPLMGSETVERDEHELLLKAARIVRSVTPDERDSVAFLDEVLANDFCEIATDGSLHQKEETLARLSEGSFRRVCAPKQRFRLFTYKIEFSDASVRVFDKSVALVTGRVIGFVETEGHPQMRPFGPELSVSLIFERRHGNWLLVFRQSTLIEPFDDAPAEPTPVAGH